MRRRLTVLVAMAVMLAMMVANAGMASAAPCGAFCESPPPGSSNTQAFTKAPAQAYPAITYNGLKRQGPQ